MSSLNKTCLMHPTTVERILLAMSIARMGNSCYVLNRKGDRILLFVWDVLEYHWEVLTPYGEEISEILCTSLIASRPEYKHIIRKLCRDRSIDTALRHIYLPTIYDHTGYLEYHSEDITPVVNSHLPM